MFIYISIFMLISVFTYVFIKICEFNQVALIPL